VQVQAIDPLNFSVVPIESFYNETRIATATGFLYSGFVKGIPYLWLISNWHVFSGRNAWQPKVILHKQGAIPNRIGIRIHDQMVATKGASEAMFFSREYFIPLYNRDDIANWYQHQSKYEVDIGLLNVGSVLPNPWPRGVNEFCTAMDMAIQIGNRVFMLGYPFGFKHFLDTPIWKQGAIASEPHFETVFSRNKIVIDATTRSGMSGAPVVMREKTHYVTETGKIHQQVNATRFIGVYASRPVIVSEVPGEDPRVIENNAEIGYVYKSQSVHEIIEFGIKGANYGEVP